MHLTVDASVSIAVQIQRLYRCFAQLRQTRAWRNHVDGGAWFLHMGSGNGNAHIHAVLEGSSIDAAALESAWLKISECRAIVGPVEKPEGYAVYIPTEPAKYLNNQATRDYAEAIHRRRKHGVLGSWIGKVKLLAKAQPSDSLLATMSLLEQPIQSGLIGMKPCQNPICPTAATDALAVGPHGDLVRQSVSNGDGVRQTDAPAVGTRCFSEMTPTRRMLYRLHADYLLDNGNDFHAVAENHCQGAASIALPTQQTPATQSLPRGGVSQATDGERLQQQTPEAKPFPSARKKTIRSWMPADECDPFAPPPSFKMEGVGIVPSYVLLNDAATQERWLALARERAF